MIDPFVPERPADEAAVQPRAALSLFELNSRVHAVLQHTLAPSYWLTAEISELRVASNGHCYLEFVEKDEDGGTLVARARANIWRSNYLRLAARFERVTHRPLAAGIKVMVEVSVTFHELYGYALNVVDLDPAYTLGDLAQRREEIIRQLTEDGVIDLNKQLPLPRIIRRVAIISSAGAAGYGDFCNQLAQSGYTFETKLFPAVMQGERAESSVIGALDEIAAEADRWDIVVIIRGGGATTDLGCFDSYLLAANVAQFPLPVLTGIGHERDDSITDLVACRRLKTPTAVAAFLVESRTAEAGRLADLVNRLGAVADALVRGERHRLDNLSRALRYGAGQTISATRRGYMDAVGRYSAAARRYTTCEHERLAALQRQLTTDAWRIVIGRRGRYEQLPPRLVRGLGDRMDRERRRLETVRRTVKLSGPDHILSLGYTMTLRNGRPVTRAEALKPGDTLTTRFADGTAESTVQSLSITPTDDE